MYAYIIYIVNSLIINTYYITSLSYLGCKRWSFFFVMFDSFSLELKFHLRHSSGQSFLLQTYVVTFHVFTFGLKCLDPGMQEIMEVVAIDGGSETGVFLIGNHFSIGIRPEPIFSSISFIRNIAERF